MSGGLKINKFFSVKEKIYICTLIHGQSQTKMAIRYEHLFNAETENQELIISYDYQKQRYEVWLLNKNDYGISINHLNQLKLNTLRRIVADRLR